LNKISPGEDLRLCGSDFGTKRHLKTLVITGSVILIVYFLLKIFWFDLDIG
jgi:hypothetical protein